MKNRYRQGVGAVLYNAQGLIFVAERIDLPGAWQLPQGGIDSGETPEQALKRELEEEIGTGDMSIDHVYPTWLRYDIPPQFLKTPQRPDWEGVIGQEQKWFLGRFLQESAINIKTPHPEFSRWCWRESESVIEGAPEFKKGLYKMIFNVFEPMIQERCAC